MSDLRAAFLAGLAFLMPAAAARADDIRVCGNEPPGSTPLNSHGFESITGDGWWNVYPGANYQIITDNTAPKSPPYVLQQTRPPNSTGGAWTGVDFPQRREVYACIWWKPSSPFYGWSNNTQKIVSFQPDSNMFLIWFGDRTSPRSLGVLLQSGQEVQHHKQACSWNGALTYGSCNLYANRSSGIVSAGQWHKIEWYVRSSSAKNVYDGAVRWWVDGALAGEYSEVATYGTGYTNFQVNHTWDAGDPSQPSTDYHWFDHAYVSAPGGGPVAPLPPPPPPPPPAAAPGAVTNLAASQIGSNGLTLSFNQVDDGTGAPAKYAVRYSSAGLLWGGGLDATEGTCSTPLQGTSANGPMTCTVLGLSPSTGYDFQLVAFRGTLNQGATYGPLSNMASAATSSANAVEPTDINQDGTTDIADVQIGINQALAVAACARADVNADGACTILDIQRIVNKTLGI